jgi:hypothetical protein
MYSVKNEVRQQGNEFVSYGSPDFSHFATNFITGVHCNTCSYTNIHAQNSIPIAAESR